MCGNCWEYYERHFRVDTYGRFPIGTLKCRQLTGEVGAGPPHTFRTGTRYVYSYAEHARSSMFTDRIAAATTATTAGSWHARASSWCPRPS